MSGVAAALGHFRQRLKDLFLGVVNTLERTEEKVVAFLGFNRHGILQRCGDPRRKTHALSFRSRPIWSHGKGRAAKCKGAVL